MIEGSAASPLSRADQTGSGRGPQQMTIREAASQFEALLIGQMLKEMRTSEAGGWLGGGEEASGGTIIELAEEQLARALTIQGGLGLGRLIADQFKAEASVAASTGNQVPVKPETGV